MKIKLAVAATVLLTVLYGEATAQTGNPLRLGIGLNPGVSLGDETGFVLGADARLQQSITKNLSWILTAGYTRFFDRTYTIQTQTGTTTNKVGYEFIPLKMGLKAFVVPKLYVAGEAGAAYSTMSTSNNFSFVYAPSVGTVIGNNIDLSLKYEHFTAEDQTRQLALRIAYGFKL